MSQDAMDHKHDAAGYFSWKLGREGDVWYLDRLDSHEPKKLAPVLSHKSLSMLLEMNGAKTFEELPSTVFVVTAEGTWHVVDRAWAKIPKPPASKPQVADYVRDQEDDWAGLAAHMKSWWDQMPDDWLDRTLRDWAEKERAAGARVEQPVSQKDTQEESNMDYLVRGDANDHYKVTVTKYEQPVVGQKVPPPKVLVDAKTFVAPDPLTAALYAGAAIQKAAADGLGDPLPEHMGEVRVQVQPFSG